MDNFISTLARFRSYDVGYDSTWVSWNSLDVKYSLNCNE